jgi:5'-methylthioadenosine phosphorylase
MEGLEDVREVEVSTPFGPTSDNLITGTYAGRTLVFIPRHGKGHRFLPSEVPYRANIWALKSLGVEAIISISAVGSLAEEARPGDIVLPDQFIDRSVGRDSTFFGNGIVGHVAMADPVCNGLGDAIMSIAGDVDATFHRGGTYLCMQGPQFSTRGESNLYRQWGARIIGMTNATEAKLAREAEICYTTVALVTDYDCWHETEEEVSVEAILEVLHRNVNTAKDIIRKVVPTLSAAERTCACASAAQYAVMTPAELIPAETKRAVELLFGKYLG